MLNMIAIMGRLTHTPELRTTTSGKEVCSFDIACERSYSANGQRETDFLPCVAWGKTAQFVSQYFDKGSMIAVNGSIPLSPTAEGVSQKRFKALSVGQLKVHGSQTRSMCSSWQAIR